MFGAPRVRRARAPCRYYARPVYGLESGARGIHHSCVLSRVRSAFPEPNGTYAGHAESGEWHEEVRALARTRAAAQLAAAARQEDDEEDAASVVSSDSTTAAAVSDAF